MTDITFAQPYWGWLLMLLPLWWILYRRFGGQNLLEIVKNGRTGHFRHPFFHVFLGAKKSAVKILGGPPWWLRLLQNVMVVVGVLALMQPGREQVVQQVETVHARHQLAFVVESSVTMTLSDYGSDDAPVSRMDAVRGALAALMKRLDQGRYGLVLYGEQAATWLPQTQDRQLFIDTLSRLQPYLLGRTDEGVGAGLGLALRQENLDAVVLISDGINRPSHISLTQVVALAQARKVPLFTVGVGAGKARPRETAGLIFQPLDAGPLRQLASLTGGQFFAIHDADGLQQALAAIERKTGTRWTESRQIKQWQDFSPWLMGVLLALMGLYGALIWWLARREGGNVPL